MGFAMAANIRRKIPPESILYINDINVSACARFKTEYSSYGPIEIVSTAREAADDAKVLVSIVPGAADVKSVFLDEKNGVIASKKDGERVMCECSTIDVKSTKEIGEVLIEGGLGTYVDTPVSVCLLFSLDSFCTKLKRLGRRTSSRARRPEHADRARYAFLILPQLSASRARTWDARFALQVLLSKYTRRRANRQNLQ